MQKYRRIVQFIGPYRSSFLLIFALTLAATPLAALQPWPAKLLVDHVLSKEPLPGWLEGLMAASGLSSTPMSVLALLVVGGLALYLAGSLLEAWLAWTWTVAGRRSIYDLALEMFTRLQKRSVLYHGKRPIGDTMGRITVDSWSVYQVVESLLVAPLHALLTMAFMIALMWRLNVTLTWVALVAAPFMVGASFLLGKRMRKVAASRREIESQIQSHVQQTLTGIPVVQAFAQEEREQERFQKFADAVIRTQQRSTLLGSFNSLSSGLVTTVGSGVILWLAAHQVVREELTIGSLLVFLVYLTSLQAQIKTLAGFYTAWHTLGANVDRVNEVLEGRPEVTDKPGARQIEAVRGRVRFENVTFGYEPGQPVLKELSLNVEPGQKIALVGPTGAGKTTLINLIPRFFDPWEGRVLLDGADVRDVTLRSLRERVSLVLQEPFLFPLSVAENIAFGRPDASRAEIETAARAANAHEFISKLPEGFDTVIGQRGATLSGGERQRLAIARALLKDAPILILDEPTSALDARTEQLIMEALERLMKGRTTFIIAHRLSTVRRADRIAMLGDGRIIEIGTHDELVDLGGAYARFHQTQFGPARAAAPEAVQ